VCGSASFLHHELHIEGQTGLVRTAQSSKWIPLYDLRVCLHLDIVAIANNTDCLSLFHRSWFISKWWRLVTQLRRCQTHSSPPIPVRRQKASRPRSGQGWCQECSPLIRSSDVPATRQQRPNGSRSGARTLNSQKIWGIQTAAWHVPCLPSGKQLRWPSPHLAWRATPMDCRGTKKPSRQRPGMSLFQHPPQVLTIKDRANMVTHLRGTADVRCRQGRRGYDPSRGSTGRS
jgi:hypothetical protein